MAVKNKFIGLTLCLALVSAPSIMAAEKNSVSKRVATWCLRHPVVTSATAAAVACYALYYAEPHVEAVGYPTIAAAYDVVGKGAAVIAVGAAGVAALSLTMKEFFFGKAEALRRKAAAQPLLESGVYHLSDGTLIKVTQLSIADGQYFQLDQYDVDCRFLNTFYIDRKTNQVVGESVISNAEESENFRYRFGM